MLSRGQARFPLLLTIFLLAGLALSQTEPLPPSLTWTSQSTDATFDGSVYTSQNTLAVANVPAGTISVLIAGCPSDWVCVADPATFEHAGADASYPVSTLIIAPQDSTGAISATASNGAGANSGEWVVNLVPQPPAELPPEQPPEEPPQEQPPATEPQPPLPAQPGAPEIFADASSCGELSQSTRLTGDVYATGLVLDWHPCFTLVSLRHTAVLDCQGHSIIGAGIGTGIVTQDNERSGWELRNCNVRGFDYGLDLTANNLTIRNADVSNSKVWSAAGGSSPSQY